MAYVASRRITLLLLCLVCRVMAYMCTHAMTVVIAIENVYMTRRLLFTVCHITVLVVAAFCVFAAAAVAAVCLSCFSSLECDGDGIGI